MSRWLPPGAGGGDLPAEVLHPAEGRLGPLQHGLAGLGPSQPGEASQNTLLDPFKGGGGCDL